MQHTELTSIENYYVLRRPLAEDVRGSRRYAQLLLWLEKALTQPRLRHGIPKTVPRSDFYWELGGRFAAFGEVPGLYAALARDLEPRLPASCRLSSGELRRAYKFYRAYAADPRLAGLARDISFRHNLRILQVHADPVAREFYIRLVRSLRLKCDVLVDWIQVGLYEQVEAAFGRPGPRAWLDEVLGEVDALPPTTQTQILELLHSDPNLSYVAIGDHLGLTNDYVRTVAIAHGLDRIGDYTEEIRQRSYAVAARALGMDAEEYSARRAANQRWCSSCEQWIPKERFERPRTGAPQGSYCIECLKEYMAGLCHKRRLEMGEMPQWMRYRDWWEEIYERLEEMPLLWQQAFLELEVPSLTAMGEVLGLNRSTFRKQWLKAGFPPPPAGSFRFRWKFDTAALLQS